MVSCQGPGSASTHIQVSGSFPETQVAESSPEALLGMWQISGQLVFEEGLLSLRGIGGIRWCGSVGQRLALLWPAVCPEQFA